jgi:hypothetical protein
MSRIPHRFTDGGWSCQPYASPEHYSLGKLLVLISITGWVNRQGHSFLKVRPPLWSSGQSSWLQNGDILCFLWIYICYVEESRPPPWSSVQSSWLQIQRSRFDSRRYHIIWEVVGLERGPPSLASTTEELLGRNSSGSGLESRDYGPRDPSRWPRSTLYSQNLALTSPTGGVR